MNSLLRIALATLAAVALAAALFLRRGDDPATASAQPAAKFMATHSSSSPDSSSLQKDIVPADTSAPAMAEAPHASSGQTQPALHRVPATTSPHPVALPPAITDQPRSVAVSGEPRTQPTSATPRATALQRVTEGPSLPVAASQIPATFSAQPSPVEFTVPRGAVLPAALVDPAENVSGPQADVLDRLAGDFLSDLAKPAEPTPPPVVTPARKRPASQTQPDRWNAATRQADERYRQLFGVEAYNAWTAAAAKEALADK